MEQTQVTDAEQTGASLPDASGHFGPYGGRFVAETLMLPLDELTEAYTNYLRDPEFLAELDSDLTHFVGRPSPLYYAERWSNQVGGARIYLKREDLNHTGAHKINNTVGQALLAKRMGKRRVIAETGAGQHGVATATACALLGLECVVYMGTTDMARQQLNVFRMRLLGAEVLEVLVDPIGAVGDLLERKHPVVLGDPRAAGDSPRPSRSDGKKRERDFDRRIRSQPHGCLPFHAPLTADRQDGFSLPVPLANRVEPGAVGDGLELAELAAAAGAGSAPMRRVR